MAYDIVVVVVEYSAKLLDDQKNQLDSIISAIVPLCYQAIFGNKITVKKGGKIY